MWHCCCLSTCSVYTIQPCTRLQCHFIQSHTGRVYVCLAVTSHLHFGQNDPDLLVLCATAVTQGWNGYRNINYPTMKYYIGCGSFSSFFFSLHHLRTIWNLMTFLYAILVGLKLHISLFLLYFLGLVFFNCYSCTTEGHQTRYTKKTLIQSHSCFSPE